MCHSHKELNRLKRGKTYGKKTLNAFQQWSIRIRDRKQKKNVYLQLVQFPCSHHFIPNAIQTTMVKICILKILLPITNLWACHSYSEVPGQISIWKYQKMSMEVYMSSYKVSEALKLIKINYQSERRKLPRQYQPVRITSPKKVVNRCVLLSMHDAKPEYRLKTRSDDWIWACFL